MSTPPSTCPHCGAPEQLELARAKLSERKTVHQWLNAKSIPTHETTGKRMCLLRRLAVALGVAPHEPPTVKDSLIVDLWNGGCE